MLILVEIRNQTGRLVRQGSLGLLTKAIGPDGSGRTKNTALGIRNLAKYAGFVSRLTRSADTEASLLYPEC